MVLFVASAIKRIVLDAVFEVFVFAIVKELPPELRPSMVTLSAPFKSINGTPLASALIVRAAPPAGWIRIEVYDAEPDPLALRTIEVPSSTGFPQTSTVIVPV